MRKLVPLTGAAYWDMVRRTAEQVSTWPAWKTGAPTKQYQRPIVVSTGRAQNQIMKRTENILKTVAAAGGVATWDAILAAKNDAKQFSTRYSRNAQAANELIAAGKLTRATAAQCTAYAEAYQRHTARIVRRVQRATACGSWKLVGQLAETLQHRAGQTSFDLFTIA